MRPIGGYFGLEIPKGKLPYPNAVPVNFGRGGLELIVRTRGYKKIWIPDYICPVVPQHLSKLGVVYATYEINERLEPSSIPDLGFDEAFLYVNYFGVKDAYCHSLEELFSTRSTCSARLNNLILDLTQAFYYEPTKADGFNSCRKFFGVPDGGFTFGEGLSNSSLPDSISYDRCSALLRRADGDISGGYSVFQHLDESLCEFFAAKMSSLTRALIASCDLPSAAEQRRANFAQLHAALATTNKFPVTFNPSCVSLIYPYLAPDGAALKKRLISEKVFCPTYWPNIAHMGSAAKNLVENLVCIPMDQRYNEDDMNRILEVVVK